MKKLNTKRVLAIFLVLIILCSQISIAANNETTKDGSIVTKYTEDKNELKGKLNQGEVNVVKSVEYNKNKTFDVSLKAQGLGFTKEKISQNEYNIVFVIDNSGSMYGDSGRAKACVSAINSVIKDLAKSTNIQISVVAYSSGSHMDYSSDGNEADYISSNTISADTLLDLKHYDASTYIGYVDNYGTGKGKDYDSRNTLRWMYSSTGKKFYAGNTNTQAGIIKAYEVLKGAKNKKTATPVVILMSDGEATNYAYSGNRLTGFKYELDSMSKLDNLKSAFNNRYTENQLAGYSAILSANYIKYKLNSQYTKKCMFYTLGYSLEQNYEYSSATLNPTQANLKKASDMVGSKYKKYGLQDLTSSSTSAQSAKTKYGVSDLKYNDKYYEGNTRNIEAIYKNIVNDSMTEYEHFGPIKNVTYLTIVDALGDKFKINTDKETIQMKLKTESLSNSNSKQEKNITLSKKDTNTYVYSDENIEVTYSVVSRKVTLKILAKYIDGNKVDLRYQVDLQDDATGSIEGITYYTNDTQNTYYEFTPENGNSYYSGNKIEEKIITTGSITLKKEEKPEEPKEPEEPKKPEEPKETVTEKNTVIENTIINNVTENNINKENVTEKNTTIINETQKNVNTTNEIVNNKTTNNETVNNKTINNTTENNKIVNKETEVKKVKLPKTGRDIDISSNIKNKLTKKYNI